MRETTNVEVDKTLHQAVRLLAVVEGRLMREIMEEALTTGPVGERIRAMREQMRAAMEGTPQEG